MSIDANHGIESVNYELVALTAEHSDLIGSFCCGNEVIDDFLKYKSWGNEESGITYLFLSDNNDVLAFMTLSCSSLVYKDSSVRQSFPAIEIRYFAVAKKYQKFPMLEDDGEIFYLSDQILCDAIAFCKKISEETIGADYILLYSVDYAVKFYKRNSFKPLAEYFAHDKKRYLDGCTPMYMDL